MNILRFACAILVTLVMAPAASAEDAAVAALKAGDALPVLTLPDQHGVSTTVTLDTTTLVFTRDMDGGGFVKEVLAEGGTEKLAAARAVYIADVSGMPGFVRRTFALPSMRKRPYPMLIDETGAATKMLPSEEGKATILRVSDGKVSDVKLAASTDEVAAALTPP
ncbi:MAG TPA: hypothetical protein VEL28_01080 [Candidatus Binatia bacterium]|nr:hypothetical protein [Candidatus Binatia bacterium]